jgi:protein translocase SecG subunit
MIAITMEEIVAILPYAEIVVSVLLIASVTMQQRGAGLGGAFGDSFAATYYKRRGAELFFFYASIVLGLALVLLALTSLFTS